MEVEPWVTAKWQKRFRNLHPPKNPKIHPQHCLIWKSIASLNVRFILNSDLVFSYSFVFSVSQDSAHCMFLLQCTFRYEAISLLKKITNQYMHLSYIYPAWMFVTQRILVLEWKRDVLSYFKEISIALTDFCHKTTSVLTDVWQRQLSMNIGRFLLTYKLNSLKCRSALRQPNQWWAPAVTLSCFIMCHVTMTNLSSICKHTPFTNHGRENTVAVSNAALNLSRKYNFHINSPEHCENNLYAHWSELKNRL